MQKIKLNLTPGKVAPVCYASQGDVGLAIRFLLFDGETAITLSGTEVITLAIKKADGSELEESVTNTGSNYVDVITTADTCDTPGASLCELRFQDGGDDLGTGNFIMEVEADAYAGANIEERTASGTIATFDTNLVEALTSCKCEINALQSGTGTPSPSNPRAISGFSGANIVRCGVNLWDEEWVEGSININTGVIEAGTNKIRSVNYTLIKDTENYYVKSPYATTTVLFYDASKTYLGYQTLRNSVLTPPTGACYFMLRVGANAEPISVYNNDISINYPATDTTYHTYNGNTTAIPFGQTVYGGVLDVTNGVLRVTHGYKSLDGTETWSQAGSGDNIIFSTPISDMETGTNLEGLSNYFPLSTSFYNYGCRFGYENNVLYIYQALTISGVTDLASFKTWLSNNNLQICYPLATTTEITLTAKEIETIVGQVNNVYHDCNGQIEVKYLVEV